MPLTVLSVAYPVSPVGPSAVGGAEQILAAVDAALVAGGHRSLVIAQEGSSCHGELIPISRPRGSLDTQAQVRAHAEVRAAIAGALRRWDVDVVHMHGADFHAYLPEAGVPVLVTLHLPPGWYPKVAFRRRPGVYLQCVSASQRRACPEGAALLEDIPNGVDLEALRFEGEKGGAAVMLGRVCPEKGFDEGLRAAHLAGVELIAAGRVFDFPEHRAYFEEKVAPLLDARRRLIAPVGLDEKRELLGRARCLLVPSLAPETSSLVAMEALACGTPVIAYPSGALKEIVEHGRTGFLVRGEEQLAEAIRRAGELDPRECRRAAERRFSSEGMTRRYLATYRALARHGKARHRNPLRAERLDGLEALESLRPAWSELLERCPEASPFQSPEWLLPELRELGASGLRTHALWRGSELVGLLPLKAFPWLGENLLAIAGAEVSDFLDAIADPALDEEELGELLRPAWGDGGWDRLALEQLRPSSPLLRAALPEGTSRELESAAAAPALALPREVERLGDAVPAGTLADVRYCRRRAEREGGLRIRAATGEDLDALLGALFRLHAARWAERGEPGVLAEEAVRRFHRAAARGLLGRGWLRTYGLWIGGALAAVLYGFARGRTAYYYLGGFDPALRRYGPGKLLIAHALEEAIREGIDTFDFLRGREPYKYAWGAKDRPLLWLSLRRNAAHESSGAAAGAGG